MAHQLIDISSNNRHPINWAAVRASGVEAVAIKATEGTGYTNPFYAADSRDAAAAGLLVVAYHFADYGDPAAEAAHFLAVAGPLARILDRETSTNTAWADAFMAHLNLTAAREMEYGSASTLRSGQVRALLWPAGYGRNPGFGDEWQDTDAANVPGISGPVDHSVWTGTDADWDAFWGLDEPAPTPPPPPPAPFGETMILTDPTTGNVWAVLPTGAVFAPPGPDGSAAPYLGGCNNAKYNPQGLPCIGGAVWTDPQGKAGYVLALDRGPAAGANRIALFHFPRSGAAAVS